jgi:hypothetical protein
MELTKTVANFPTGTRAIRVFDLTEQKYNRLDARTYTTKPFTVVIYTEVTIS